MNMGKLLRWTVGLLATGLGLFELFSHSNAEPQKYSQKWFESIPTDVLNNEREEVRKQFCSAGRDYSLGTRLQNLLRIFDAELNRRACGNEKPHAPSIHREHGWYLPNDD